MCEILKTNLATLHIPIVFVTPTSDIQSENDCWEVGASDFVVKPVNASTLIHRIKTHFQNKLRTEFLELMTFQTQLAGFYNRMYLTKEIPLLINHVAKDEGNLGAMVIDIDYLTLYNDSY